MTTPSVTSSASTTTDATTAAADQPVVESPATTEGAPSLARGFGFGRDRGKDAYSVSLGTSVEALPSPGLATNYNLNVGLVYPGMYLSQKEFSFVTDIALEGPRRITNDGDDSNDEHVSGIELGPRWAGFEPRFGLKYKTTYELPELEEGVEAPEPGDLAYNDYWESGQYKTEGPIFSLSLDYRRFSEKYPLDVELPALKLSTTLAGPKFGFNFFNTLEGSADVNWETSTSTYFQLDSSISSERTDSPSYIKNFFLGRDEQENFKIALDNSAHIGSKFHGILPDTRVALSFGAELTRDWDMNSAPEELDPSLDPDAYTVYTVDQTTENKTDWTLEARYNILKPDQSLHDMLKNGPQTFVGLSLTSNSASHLGDWHYAPDENNLSELNYRDHVDERNTVLNFTGGLGRLDADLPFLWDSVLQFRPEGGIGYEFGSDSPFNFELKATVKVKKEGQFK